MSESYMKMWSYWLRSDVWELFQDVIILTIYVIIVTGVKPVEYDPKYPVVIAKLRKNQSLKFSAIAKKGLGKMHAKWSPASGIVFTYEPVLRLNFEMLEKLSQEQKSNWVALCPPGVLKFNEVGSPQLKTSAQACKLHIFPMYLCVHQSMKLWE